MALLWNLSFMSNDLQSWQGVLQSRHLLIAHVCAIQVNLPQAGKGLQRAEVLGLAYWRG